MAKGEIIFVSLMGSVGTPAKDYDTKQIMPGVYRHSQTVNGTTYSWKCGELRLNGRVKLVEDEYNGQVFFRMEGITTDLKAKETLAAWETLEW